MIPYPDIHGQFTAPLPLVKQNMLTALIQSQQPELQLQSCSKVDQLSWVISPVIQLQQAMTIQYPDTHGKFTAPPPPVKPNMLTALTQSQQPS
jgi:hypothetical protein